MRILGIDVSHHQGELAWDSLAGGEVKFAFAKATEGTTFVDSRFKENWEGMRQLGIHRGAYHFARPGSDPGTQAAHFASVVGTLSSGDLPPVLDLEVTDGHSVERVLHWARMFVEKAEELLDRRLLIYTYQSFWIHTLHDANVAFFAERPLWLAAYVPSERLTLPKNWSQWTFWQYSDGTHNDPRAFPGFPRCDQNYFGGTAEDLVRVCEGAAPQPGSSPPVPEWQWPGIYFVWPKTPGVSGPAVQAWQERMCDFGFPLTCDGEYGPKSKTACQAFQGQQGLSVDGIVGRLTWNAAFAEEQRRASDAGTSAAWTPPAPPQRGAPLDQALDPRVVRDHLPGQLPCPVNPPPPAGWVYRQDSPPGGAELALALLGDSEQYSMGAFVQQWIGNELVGARVEWHDRQGATGRRGCFRGVSLMRRR